MTRIPLNPRCRGSRSLDYTAMTMTDLFACMPLSSSLTFDSSYATAIHANPSISFSPCPVILQPPAAAAGCTPWRTWNEEPELRVPFALASLPSWCLLRRVPQGLVSGGFSVIPSDQLARCSSSPGSASRSSPSGLSPSAALLRPLGLPARALRRAAASVSWCPEPRRNRWLRICWLRHYIKQEDVTSDSSLFASTALTLVAKLREHTVSPASSSPGLTCTIIKTFDPSPTKTKAANLVPKDPYQNCHRCSELSCRFCT